MNNAVSSGFEQAPNSAGANCSDIGAVWMPAGAARWFLLLAFAINVSVAGFMGFVILLRIEPIVDAFGDQTPASRILAAVYLAIACISFFGFFKHARTIASVLLPMQIVYKLLTLATVSPSDPSNRVPWSNLAISVFHFTTLWLMFPQQFAAFRDRVSCCRNR
jgi:hypothetical protein